MDRDKVVLVFKTAAALAVGSYVYLWLSPTDKKAKS